MLTLPYSIGLTLNPASLKKHCFMQEYHTFLSGESAFMPAEKLKTYFLTSGFLSTLKILFQKTESKNWELHATINSKSLRRDCPKTGIKKQQPLIFWMTLSALLTI